MWSVVILKVYQETMFKLKSFTGAIVMMKVTAALTMDSWISQQRNTDFYRAAIGMLKC